MVSEYKLINGDCIKEMQKLIDDGVACLQTDRNFIGIELDEKYYDIAKQRINEAKTQGRLI